MKLVSKKSIIPVGTIFPYNVSGTEYTISHTIDCTNSHTNKLIDTNADFITMGVKKGDRISIYYEETGNVVVLPSADNLVDASIRFDNFATQGVHIGDITFKFSSAMNDDRSQCVVRIGGGGWQGGNGIESAGGVFLKTNLFNQHLKHKTVDLRMQRHYNFLNHKNWATQTIDYIKIELGCATILDVSEHELVLNKSVCNSFKNQNLKYKLYNTELLPFGFEYCDGQVCNDLGSVFNGLELPPINSVNGYVIGVNNNVDLNKSFGRNHHTHGIDSSGYRDSWDNVSGSDFPDSHSHYPIPNDTRPPSVTIPHIIKIK